MALTCGLLWGGCVLLCSIGNILLGGYAEAFLEICASIYPGYEVAQTASSVIAGTAYAFMDGLVGGAFFAWLYNIIVKRLVKPEAE